MIKNHKASLADFTRKKTNNPRGPFRHVEFGTVIMPFMLPRGLECALRPPRGQDIENSKKSARASPPITD
jgi:hypothetical protein